MNKCFSLIRSMLTTHLNARYAKEIYMLLLVHLLKLIYPHTRSTAHCSHGKKQTGENSIDVAGRLQLLYLARIATSTKIEKTGFRTFLP